MHPGRGLRRYPWVLVSLMAASAGCGSPSVVLKVPIADECASTGLSGCPEIAEGMLLYVEGKRPEAVEKLARGAAQNSPEQVRAFAAALAALRSVPGADAHLASVEEAVGVLVEHAGPHKQSPGVEEVDAVPLPRPLLTADTDPSRTVGGVVEPYEALAEAAWCRTLAGEGATCREVHAGPAYLTDLVSLGSDCQGQFVAVVRRSDAARFVLSGPFRIHGARLFLQPGEVLVAGQKTQPARAPSAANDASDLEDFVLEEDDPHWQCNLLWSGFVPYGARDASGL